MRIAPRLETWIDCLGPCRDAGPDGLWKFDALNVFAKEE